MTHGTTTAYTYHGCRCGACRRAQAAYMKRYRHASPRAKAGMRVRSLAQNNAVKWLIAECPDVWDRLLDAAWVEVTGSVPSPVGAKTTDLAALAATTNPEGDRNEQNT